MAPLCFSAFIACGPPEAGPDPDGNPPVVCAGAGDYEFADELVEAPGTVSAPSAVNVPQNAVNGVVHGDRKSGSLDVFSRGLSTSPPNNYLVIRWSGRTLTDVPGPDFVVFENAFEAPGGVFMDPAVVSVSSDGTHWVDFPHDYLAEDETSYSSDPSKWLGFAGVSPVVWRSDDSRCLDPIDPAAGGDRFDIADVELDGPARFVRITTAASLRNPDTDAPYPKEFIADGFDLDGVFAAATSEDPESF